MRTGFWLAYACGAGSVLLVWLVLIRPYFDLVRRDRRNW